MRRQIYRNRVKRDIYIHIILLLLLAAFPNNGSQARLLGRGKPLFVATDAHPASAQGGEFGSAMSASSLFLGEGGGEASSPKLPTPCATPCRRPRPPTRRTWSASRRICATPRTSPRRPPMTRRLTPTSWATR